MLPQLKGVQEKEYVMCKVLIDKCISCVTVWLRLVEPDDKQWPLGQISLYTPDTQDFSSLSISFSECIQSV